MEKILEKIKGLDKRIFIGAGIAIAVVIILIIALIVGGSKPSNSNDDSKGTGYGTETEGDVSEVIGTEEEIETEMATETEMTTEVIGENLDGSNLTVTQPDEVGGVEQKPVTITPDGEEILGLGSKDQPYDYVPDATGSGVSLTTVEIPAGKTLYYKVMKIGGMYLNIEDSDLYIIDSKGNRHDSSFTVENAMANEYVLLQIGNKGNSSKAFTINFSNLYGSFVNPEKISTIGSYSKSLASGNETGHYYKYVAEKTGTIRFYIDSASKECEMSVTNNAVSINRTFESDALTDANGKTYIELNVTQGDTIMIQICVKPDKRWNYPATDITWSGIYQ